MIYSSLRPERPIPADRRNNRRSGNASAWHRIIANLTGPDFIAVAWVCVVGLLVTLALFHFVPSSRELTNSIHQLL